MPAKEALTRVRELSASLERLREQRRINPRPGAVQRDFERDVAVATADTFCENLDGALRSELDRIDCQVDEAAAASGALFRLRDRREFPGKGACRRWRLPERARARRANLRGRNLPRPALPRWRRRAQIRAGFRLSARGRERSRSSARRHADAHRAGNRPSPRPGYPGNRAVPEPENATREPDWPEPRGEFLAPIGSTTPPERSPLRCASSSELELLANALSTSVRKRARWN
jgi:hypothetical protein